MNTTNDTRNLDALAANSKLVAERAAKTLPVFKPKPKKRARKGHFPIMWALLATQQQIDADPRLKVIHEFFKATKPVKGCKASPRRGFLIQSLFDAIVKAAK